MKKLLLTAALSAIMAASAHAETTIGFSMQRFDDNFLAILRSGLEAHAKELGDVKVLIEDAQGDVSKQQSQIDNFIASKVDGMIVIPVEADAGVTISKTVEKAGIPLVFANNQPSNVDNLPENQGFVGSDQVEAGTLEAEEVCRLLGGKGKAVILMGELGTLVARGRTEAVHQVFKTDECKGIEIVDEQTATWQRMNALDLVTNWLTAGIEFNAVIANNDEMALGAVQALKSAGKSTDDVVVAGIDATQDALVAMKAGDMKVTVQQDAALQGKDALDAILKLVKGEPTEQKIFSKLKLVTKDNLSEFLN
ncbi:sugar ABC transporter substrate-binding protein [Sinorhizobium americanum]|uniref:Inositol transport system substrate-binding protein n=1 Tax=Sinorhizobium americanum TaxID=194963 RepID=A0A4R2B965_9HYPH|nr:sugar ABC transporter substrate-binding protein [Sinorhizobium americanum]TCN22825.1 inositol transport system substrate-binding protein [Sinorhizobium americanum]